MAYSGFNIDVLHRYVEKIASQVVSLNGSNTISMGTIEESLAGYYNVKLTNGDTSATVAALSINDNTYKVDDYVYLVKAENGGTTTKYFIVGLVSDIQEDFVNLTDLERFEEDKLTTINTLTSTITIPRSGDTNAEDTALLGMIKDQGFFVVSGYFTCLADDGQKVNNYGIKLTMSYEETEEDENSTKSSTSTYYLDTHYFTGQPFKTLNSFQKRLIKLDKTQGLKSISLQFYYDKINGKEDPSGLQATNVAIAAGILKEITQKLSVKVEAQNDKNYFYKTELAAGDNSVTLVATPYADKQVLSANSIQYYWMIEDASITKDSSNYLHFVGEGWRCLNTYHEVDAIGTTEKVKVWNNKNNSITFDASDENFAQYVSHVKCAIRYQNVVAISDALGIINYNNEDFYAKLESNVEPKLLILDTDKVELTCNVDDNNDFTKKSDYKFLYQWQKKVGEEFVPLERYKDEKEPVTEEPEIVFIFNEKDVKLIIKDDGKAEQEHQYEMIQNESAVIFRCAVEIYKKQTSEEDKEENILIATVISNEVEITSKVSMSAELSQPTYYKYYVSSSDSVLFAKKDVPEFFKTQDESKFANKNYYIKQEENYVLFEGEAFKDEVDYYEKNDPYGWVGDWVILDPDPAAAETWIPIEEYIDIDALNVLKNYELGKDQYLYYTYQTKWVEKAIAEENQKDTTEEGEEKQEPQEILLKEEKWALPRLLRGKIGDIELPSETIDKMNAFNDLTGGGKNQGIYLEEIYERTQDTKPQGGKVYYYINGTTDGKPKYTKFDGKVFLSDKVYYEKVDVGQKKLYINAEYIKTGALLVGDDKNSAKFYADIDSDKVIINGSTIIQGTIAAEQLDAEAIKSSNYKAGSNEYGFSEEGTFLDLDTGTISSPNFAIDATGNAIFGGTLTTNAKKDLDLVESVQVYYALSKSATEFKAVEGTEGQWSTTAPTWKENTYMWQKTVTTRSGGTEKETMTCIQGAKGEPGPDGIYIKTIIEQYFLSTNVNRPTGGQWIDIVDNSKIPIVKGYYRFRRQKYIWSNHVEGTVQGQDGYNITYSVARLDETDQRIVDWCSENDFTFIDGGHIYAHSISTAQLATNAITSIGDANGQGKYSYTEGNYSNAGSKFDLESGNIITPKFSVIDGSAYIDGNITARDGSIGGWQIGENELSSSSSQVGLHAGDEKYAQSLITTGTSYVRFFCGKQSPQNGKFKAAFMVLADGSLYATAAKFSGPQVSFDDNVTINTGNNQPTTLGKMNSIINSLNTTIEGLNATITELEKRVQELEEEKPKGIFTITFDGNGGSPASQERTTENYILSELPSVSREEYVFVGWFTEKEGGTKITSSTKFNGNTTVYAQWKKNTTYKVTFDYNDGSGNKIEAKTNTQGRLIELPDLPTDSTDSRFCNGWFDAREGGNKVTLSTEFTQNSTVYAQWRNAATYTIILDYNDESGRIEETSTQSDSTLASLPVPTRENHRFNGWFTAAEGGSKITENIYIFSENTTIYAQWTDLSSVYTINFLDNVAITENEIQYETVDTVEINVETGRIEEGAIPSALIEEFNIIIPETGEEMGPYRFQGWISGIGRYVDNNTKFNKDTNVYSHFTLANDLNQDNLEDGSGTLIYQRLQSAIEASVGNYPDLNEHGRNMYCSQILRKASMEEPWYYIGVDGLPIMKVPVAHSVYLLSFPGSAEIIYLNYLAKTDYTGTGIGSQSTADYTIYVLPPSTSEIGVESFVYKPNMSIWYYSDDEMKFGDKFLRDDNVQWITTVPNANFPTEVGASITVTSFNEYGTFIAEEIFVYDGTSFNLQKEEDEEEY